MSIEFGTSLASSPVTITQDAADRIRAILIANPALTSILTNSANVGTSGYEATTGYDEDLIDYQISQVMNQIAVYCNLVDYPDEAATQVVSGISPTENFGSGGTAITDATISYNYWTPDTSWSSNIELDTTVMVDGATSAAELQDKLEVDIPGVIVSYLEDASAWEEEDYLYYKPIYFPVYIIQVPYVGKKYKIDFYDETQELTEEMKLHTSFDSKFFEGNRAIPELDFIAADIISKKILNASAYKSKSIGKFSVTKFDSNDPNQLSDQEKKQLNKFRQLAYSNYWRD